MRRFVRLAVAAMILAALAAACGGPSARDGGAPNREPSAVTAPDASRPSRPTTTTVPALRPQVVTDELDAPVAVAWRPGDRRIFVAEQAGRVVALDPDGRIADDAILEVEVSTGGERGLLGMTFSADGSVLYTYITDPGGDTRVDAWRMGAGRADPTSRRTLLTVEQPFPNHNGGALVIGRDGLLYIGIGDGGGADDPEDNAQDPGSLLGKIVRLDPAAAPPPRPEIHMSGLRNPWRFTFDRADGDIWIGDVGQDAVEEIDTAPADATGINWGWNRLEGSRPVEGTPPPDARGPILEIPHDPACSVIGGYVYRGRSEPSLVGRYVYGDFCDPAIRAFTPVSGRAGPRTEIARIDSLTSFGEDPDGELWATSRTGTLVRLTGD